MKKSRYEIIKEFLSLSLPISLSSLAYFAQITVALYLISKTGDVHMLSAVGLGDMILKTFGIAFFYGMNSGIETLVSQAVGAGNLHMAGVYLQTGRIVILLFFLPICAIFMKTEQMLLSLE